MMLILDTNVISELMNPQGSQAVKSWVNSQSRARLFTTTITQAEILYGIAILPEGNRKKRLQEAAHIVFNEELFNQLLVFDSESAENFASLSIDDDKGILSPSLMPKSLLFDGLIKRQSLLVTSMIF